MNGSSVFLWINKNLAFACPDIHREKGHRFDSGNLHNFIEDLMCFHLYILYSATVDQYYIGQSEDLENRIFRHNNSGSKSTKKANDWRLVHSESFGSRSEAYSREMEIKKKKSRKYIEWLISKTLWCVCMSRYHIGKRVWSGSWFTTSRGIFRAFFLFTFIPVFSIALLNLQRPDIIKRNRKYIPARSLFYIVESILTTLRDFTIHMRYDYPCNIENKPRKYTLKRN